MTDDALLAALLQRPPAERLAFLEAECAGDSSRLRRVQNMLADHAAAATGSFPGLGTDLYETKSADEDAPEIGTVVAGRFKLLERLGEGGMGTVYVAEQTAPVRRKVALKLIKPGMDSKSVLARFETERQALAMMDHPNIAKVLDGGLTEERRPFFVMEYIKGVPITEYCDAARLDVKLRLQLFAAVCQAVQHAHQKGIIHRDLKPSNVLIALYDGKPVPKVIDFGLAKAMYQPLTERSLYTGHAQVLGTPLYMSPEQSELNNLDVDTRTDVYSLGVILYELLTGETPLDRERFRKAAWDEVLRLIREEEPKKPSTRLSTLDTLARIAANRQTEPAKLSKMIRGDLDWIVMKALEKDRGRRYETANSLARDLERFLNDEAVEACPPSAGYRLRKFVRRNKGQVLAGSLLLFALCVGLAGTAYGLREARVQRDAAVSAEQLEKEQRDLAIKERDAANSARRAEAAAAQTARDERQKAIDEGAARVREAERGDGLRLGAEARLAVRSDPALALRLAAEAVSKTRHPVTFGAYFEALSALREERALVPPDVPTHSVRFSRDGKLVYVATDQAWNAPTIDVRSWDTGQSVRSWPGLNNAHVRAFEISPDERWLAVVFSGTYEYRYDDGREPKASCFTGHVVHLIDAATCRSVRVIGRHDGSITGIAFSPDSRHLATASGDKTARVWDVETGQEVCRMKGHTTAIAEVHYHPDGQRLLTVAWSRVEHDNRTRAESDPATGGWRKVFDDGTIMPLDPLITERRLYNSYSSSGSSVSYGGLRDAKMAMIWDAKTGGQLGTLTRNLFGFIPNEALHASLPIAGRFTSGGTKIALAFEDGEAGLWDAGGGGEKRGLRGLEGGATALTTSPDGEIVAAASATGNVCLWSAATGKEIHRLTGLAGHVNHLEFDATSRRLVAATSREARVLNVVTKTETSRLQSQLDIRQATVTPDGTRVITAGSGVRVWSLAPLRGPAHVIQAHRFEIRSLCYSPDGSRLLTAGDSSVRLFDTATGRAVRTVLEKPGYLTCRSASFSPDGHSIITASGAGTSVFLGGNRHWPVHVWDAATGQCRFELRNHGTGALYAAFAPDGKRIITVDDGRKAGDNLWGPDDNGGQARIWDVATRSLLNTLTERVGTTPRFAADGRQFVSMVRTNRSTLDHIKFGGFLVYDVQTGVMRTLGRATEIPSEARIYGLYRWTPHSIDVSPNGKRVFVLRGNDLVLWDAEADRPVITIRRDSTDATAVYAAAFSPDNRHLVVARGNKALVYDSGTGKLVRTLAGHTSEVKAVAYSADGMQILTGSADKSAARWRADTGDLLAMYIGHAAAIEIVAFNPDGKQVATATKQGEVRLWPLDPVTPMLGRAPRDLTSAERERYGIAASKAKP